MSALADVLERGRERFNARFAFARRQNRRLDPAQFAELLRTDVAAIVDAVAAASPGDEHAVGGVLYDVALDLLGRDLLGPAARTSGLEQVWRELLPRIPTLLAGAPSRVVAACSNAAFNLEAEGRAASPWIETMSELAGVCPDPETFLQVGQVVAWTSGLAHYRETALARWRELPRELKLRALGVAGRRVSLPELEERLDRPWFHPGDDADGLRVVARVGGFRGFGGVFLSPPEVVVRDGLLYAYDHEFCWSIHADAFGTTLKRFAPDLPEGDPGPDPAAFSLDVGGRVSRAGGTSQVFPRLANASSSAATEHTLAITLPSSHHVFLVAGGEA